MERNESPTGGKIGKVVRGVALAAIGLGGAALSSSDSYSSDSHESGIRLISSHEITEADLYDIRGYALPLTDEQSEDLVSRATRIGLVLANTLKSDFLDTIATSSMEEGQSLNTINHAPSGEIFRLLKADSVAGVDGRKEGDERTESYHFRLKPQTGDVRFDVARIYTAFPKDGNPYFSRIDFYAHEPQPIEKLTSFAEQISGFVPEQKLSWERVIDHGTFNVAKGATQDKTPFEVVVSDTGISMRLGENR